MGALDGGWTATSLDLIPFPEEAPRPEGFREIVGDALDAKTLDDLLDGADAVWIKAAKLAGDRLDDDALPEYRRLNVDLPALALERADAAGVRRALLDSSDAVFLESWEPGRHLPDSPPCPVDHYGRTKAEAEALLRKWSDAGEGRSAQVLRYTRVRWRESGGVLALWCAAAVLGVPLKIFGPGARSGCFVHVDDATRAARRALDLTPGWAVYNLTNPPVSLDELAAAVLARHGGGTTVAASYPGHHTDPLVHAMDAGDSWERLGVTPAVSFEDMVEITYGHVRESVEQATPAILRPLRSVPLLGALVRMATASALRRRGVPL